jgi:hypothetical protein
MRLVEGALVERNSQSWFRKLACSPGSRMPLFGAAAKAPQKAAAARLLGALPDCYNAYSFDVTGNIRSRINRP